MCYNKYMEAIVNSIYAFSKIAEYGMVRSKSNIVKDDLSRVEEDFSFSIDDFNNSYEKIIKAKDEQ